MARLRSRPIAVLTAGALLAGAAPAVAATPRPPSANDVARSKQVVKDKAQQVGRIKSRLAAAAGRLETLGDQAELAMERYNGELIKLSRAKAAYADAQRRLSLAQGNYDRARDELIGFASSAYRTNGGVGGMAAVIAGQDGPQGFMDRAGMLQLLSRNHDAVMQKVNAAKLVAKIMRRQSKRAFDAQQSAFRTADQAKELAVRAVSVQKAALGGIAAEKSRLTRELSQAENRSILLAQQRSEALRQQRLAAQAKKATSNYRRGSGRSSSLVRGAGRGSMVVRSALKWIGTPYAWGGGNNGGPSYGIDYGRNTRGFDCSGLALYAWGRAGVGLDHWTGSQWTAGPHIPTSNLRPGDLVFFATNTSDPDTIHHVGIFIGDGQMVEAPYTGARVRVSSIWRNGLIGAVRPS